VDTLEREKNFYKKKYENITQEISQHPSISPTHSSPICASPLPKLKSMEKAKTSSFKQEGAEEEMGAGPTDTTSQLQKEMAELKKQLK
jgi:hypothetical protein